jgi:hypothetical protein
MQSPCCLPACIYVYLCLCIHPHYYKRFPTPSSVINKSYEFIIIKILIKKNSQILLITLDAVGNIYTIADGPE